ncbi:MAG TPA: enoyl-CoA hydratase/isomerase family protein [Thermoanaerobaculia bacterium]|nr:enoyl-CoA hydratase/isomerase family protein [Thermoanaerobaculia bacterium]
MSDVATISIERGKVNALNRELVEELRARFAALEADPAVKAIILTGSGKFFSFGWDIPEIFPWPKNEFIEFARTFTQLYLSIFECPKPVIGSLNGHTVAGGCMLAIACDRRIMAAGNAKISLNELGFRSSVFAGSVEILRFLTGSRNATEILYSANLYSGDEASAMGLVDEVVAEAEVPARANAVASELASKSGAAFANMKRLLRGQIADNIRRLEPQSIAEFADIWYSEETRERLRKITIR